MRTTVLVDGFVKVMLNEMIPYSGWLQRWDKEAAVKALSSVTPYTPATESV